MFSKWGRRSNEYDVEGGLKETYCERIQKAFLNFKNQFKISFQTTLNSEQIGIQYI